MNDRGRLRALLQRPKKAILIQERAGIKRLFCKPFIEALEDRTVFTFTRPRSFAVGDFATAGIVADFNGDGNADLAVLNTGPSSVNVLLGNGNGSFRLAANLSETYGRAIAVGDFNGDGKPDIAVGFANEIAPSMAGVYVFLGNGNGTFKSPVNYPLALPQKFGQVGSLFAGDFNGDGKTDLVETVEAYNGSAPETVYIATFLGNGDGTFQAPSLQIIPGLQQLGSAVAGDFNGDGKIDIAMAREYA